MKKVIIPIKKASTINLDEITDKSIVGIEWESGRRTFIIEKSYAEFVSISDSNTIHAWSAVTKKDYIEEAAKQRGVAYVFSSYKELYKWISEATEW